MPPVAGLRGPDGANLRGGVLMAQNTSHAVQNQRHEPRDSLDDFPTPPWATRALLERLEGREDLSRLRVREPAAGRGYMSSTLAEAFGSVEASDIHDYGAGIPVNDYLEGEAPDLVDWTIKNPPFRLAEQFISRALDTSTMGVAVFARTTFVEGQRRYRDLFSKRRPTLILHFSERVPLFKGRVRDPEVPYWNPKANKGLGGFVKPTTATAYSWFVWLRGPFFETATDWIEPCRQRLTRPGDYRVLGNPPEDHLAPTKQNQSNWKPVGEVAADLVEDMEARRG